MEGFCRGCLIQYNEPTELLQYTEKNRRLFVYSTGLQVKRNDAFTFQLCKGCYLNMKVGCKFKKLCRNSDKRLRSYLALKSAGESVDFCTFIKNNDDSFTFRLPMLGNSTPGNHKIKDEDNESTCTSIQNFMTDILESQEIPATEARIIREVIEEEADVLDDSLDSHWLQDDASIDTDFKLDFSFSPFSTPRYINNDHCYTPKKIKDEPFQNEDPQDISCQNKIQVENIPEFIKNNFDETDEAKQNCIIDRNLESALHNEGNENFFLDDLLVTPPLFPNTSGPPTPLIRNILFGEKLDSDSNDSSMHKVGQCIESFETVMGDTDILEEFFTEDTKDLKIEIESEETHESDIKDVTVKNEPIKIKYDDNKKENEISVTNNIKAVSPIENKFNITNFYCKMCNKQFKNLLALKMHFTKLHKLKIKHKNPYTRKVRICDHCGKSYFHLSQFLLHLERHNKPPSACKHCSLKFSSESKLKMHMKTHIGKSDPTPTENKKKYICTICGAGSTTETNLKTHQRRHSKSYSFHCGECGKGFYRKTDLTTHERHHTGEKPFPCEHCKRSFARRDVLNRHMKCHTDEKPFQCQYCSLRYAKRHELKAHLQKGKMCLAKRKKIAAEGKDGADSVSVYYATVVGTEIFINDLDQCNVQT